MLTGVINGLITEVHVASVVRSAGWNSTEYQNQSSPSTFDDFVYCRNHPTVGNRRSHSPRRKNFGRTKQDDYRDGSGNYAAPFALTLRSFASHNYTDYRLSPMGTTGATVDVTTVNSLGTSATNSADQFLYYATPVITGLSEGLGSTLAGRA